MQRDMRWIVATALVALAAGCGGVGSPGDQVVGIGDGATGGVGGDVLEATANGTAWTAVTLSGSYNGTTLTFGGTNGLASLQIGVPDLAGPGTFDLGPGNPSSALAFWIDATGTYSSAANGGSGVLQVTAASPTRIAGTFHFIATTAGTGPDTLTVSVTAGRFDISTP
jgi:hypothetical protein